MLLTLSHIMLGTVFVTISFACLALIGYILWCGYCAITGKETPL